MSMANLLLCGLLMLCWTRLCVALQASRGHQLSPAQDSIMTDPVQGDTTSSSETGHGLEFKDPSPLHAPCLVEDILAGIRESMDNNGELTNHSLTLFGICTSSNHSSGSVLSELLTVANTNWRNRLEDFHPVAVHSAEDDERGALMLTFDLPQSHLLKPNPVLLLAFRSPLTGANLSVKFTGQSMQPNSQTMCISGETRYVLLTGKPSEGHSEERWRISVDTKSPDMKQTLKEILTGGRSGSDIPITLLLLYPGGRGSDKRYTDSSSQTSSFLCELKRFLGDITPKDHPDSPPLQLDSLQSQPPLTLGLTSSETLLSGLINSSTLTIFSFSSCCSMTRMHHGKLALSAALLEELKQRLEQTVMKIMEVIKEEELDHRAPEKLGRLIEHSVFPRNEPPTGERQYRAFLLLKALLTITRTYEVKRGLRAIRAGHTSPVRGERCGLRSLTMSLERHAVGPNTASINNCRGQCAVPLFNPTNHAVLLKSYIESEVTENVVERAPCCVPVAYEDMDMVLLDAEGTSTELRTLANVVAKECGCR